MKTSSILTRAVFAPVAVVSLLALTVGCNSPGPHPSPAPAAHVDSSKDGKDFTPVTSPGLHPRARHHHHYQPHMATSPGPHPVSDAPTPTPAPGQ